MLRSTLLEDFSPRCPQRKSLKQNRLYHSGRAHQGFSPCVTHLSSTSHDFRRDRAREHFLARYLEESGFADSALGCQLRRSALRQFPARTRTTGSTFRMTWTTMTTLKFPSPPDARRRHNLARAFARGGRAEFGRNTCLVETARKFLLANVTSSSGDQITTYTAMRRTTGKANSDERLWVYGRRGEPCRNCGTPIESGKQGEDARTTFWCPKCQPASKS